MADMADIVAYDGAASPASHTFSPISTEKEKGIITSTWRELSSTLPIDQQNRVIMKTQKLSSGITRLSVRVEVPVAEAITDSTSAGYLAAPKVAYVESAELVYFVHGRSTSTLRKLVRMLLVNISNNITASVAAATAGPASLLFNDLISPT